MTIHFNQKNRHIAGFNLIELMVAVSIGLVITLGLSQVFVSMWGTSSDQTTLAQFQDNQRLTIAMVSAMVQQAGYYPNPATTTAAAALPTINTTTDGAVLTAGTGISGTTGSTSDTLDLAFTSSGSDNIFNCQGSTATTPTMYVNTFLVNASNQLVCSVGDNTPMTLATNVASMKIMYGVDSKGLGTTDSYMTAAQVQSANMWAKVRMVAVTLNFNNPLYKTEPPVSWVQFINLMRAS